MGEMSKIEEVARAIACSHGGKITGPSRSRATDEFGWDPDHDFMRKYIEAHWKEHEHAAGFAIEAMRNANLVYAVLEPRTEADEIAGRREFYGDSGAWLSLWNSAIDAALKE
jgi:hypothetical protein